MHDTSQEVTVIMKRKIVAMLSILALGLGVGWNISNHPESSAELEEVRLAQRSEHSHPGSDDVTGRVRVRVSPSDLGLETSATAQDVPRIAMAAE